MDTFKLYVFSLTCITLIFVQTYVDAALGETCSADTGCNTSNNEICNGGTCACKDGYYANGTSCDSNSDPLQQTTTTTPIVKVYGDSCTAASSNECPTELTCVSVLKCLCADGFYYTGSTCTSISALKPTNVSSNTQTHNSVSLTWISPDAPGYTNSYIINYSELDGSPSQIRNITSQDEFTTVYNLRAGTTYIFTVIRSIIYERSQTVPESDPVQAETKRDYGSACSGDQCRNIFSCITGKCLCADGNYYTADSCISTDGLQPSISGAQPTSTKSITVTWNSRTANNYTNSYVIKYTEKGTTDVRNNTLSGDVSSHLVAELKAGTSYTFIVVRSITREGRTQQVIDSLSYDGTSEKINYGESCVSNGTCKGTETDCYSFTCRCNPGNFWTGTICLPNANLSPSNVETETLSTTQLKVTWTPSAYPNVVTDYVVDFSPPDSSKNIVINNTSATISSLTPGERYYITVSSRSSYLNRGETASAGAVYGITKPAAIIDLAPSTSLMEPTAQIYFYKAKGRADTYTVTLTGVGSNSVENPSGPEDVLSTNFSGVSAGSYYNLTIITTRYGVSSDPFSRTIRVRGEGPEAVVDLKVFDPTSRAASVSWKRPINTKGVLYKYRIEVFSSSKCLQRINIQCRECLQAMKVYSSTETSCERETNTTIIKSDLNDVNFPVRYDLSLLPDTVYTVAVAAYNEEGKGETEQDTLYTEQEAPGDPTNFRYVSKTSESIKLSWTPPEPRPGVTTYIISVYEWDEDSNQYRTFKDVSNLGFYNVTINVTGLSSYWKYSFEMFAKTIKGDSNIKKVPEVITEESAPTAVENLEHQPVDGVYNKYQLSWRCPPQKDGRNGVIRSATVITSKFTQSAHVNQEIGDNFENSDCTWSEPITVTAEFNYTFEVYISNSIKGESTTIQRYMPAGSPSFLASERPVIQVVSGTETEKTVELLICLTCLLNNTNGLIVKSGVLVCAKGDCPIRSADEVMTADSFDKLPNWDTTAGVGFSTWYRATEDDWLNGKEASDEIKFVLGEESCGVQDQNMFCNGPLPVDRTYRAWLFACTRVSCSEGDHVEFTLDDSLPGTVIAAIVIAVVLVVLAAVIMAVYIKVIRPRSQRKRSTQYVSDTSPKDDTYEEIADGNRMSVIKDGRPEVDYYNTKDSPPGSENTYDQLKVYSNQGQHYYGQIKVTHT